MAGLGRLCKMFGGMTVSDQDGTTIKYAWDYANDVPVREDAMPFGSERHRLSERARWLRSTPPSAPAAPASTSTDGESKEPA